MRIITSSHAKQQRDPILRDRELSVLGVMSHCCSMNSCFNWLTTIAAAHVSSGRVPFRPCKDGGLSGTRPLHSVHLASKPLLFLHSTYVHCEENPEQFSFVQCVQMEFKRLAQNICASSWFCGRFLIFTGCDCVFGKASLTGQIW